MLERAVQYYSDAWSNGRVLVLNDIMAEGHEQHDVVWQPLRVGAGRRAMKRGILAYRAAYPDLNFRGRVRNKHGPGPGPATQPPAHHLLRDYGPPIRLGLQDTVVPCLPASPGRRSGVLPDLRPARSHSAAVLMQAKGGHAGRPLAPAPAD